MKLTPQRRAACVVLGLAGLALTIDKLFLSGQVSGPKHAAASLTAKQDTPRDSAPARAGDPSVLVAMRLAAHAGKHTAQPADAYALPISWLPITEPAKPEAVSSSPGMVSDVAQDELPIRGVRVASLVGREIVSIEFEAMLTSENGQRSMQKRSQSLQVGRPVRIEEGLILHLTDLSETNIELSVNNASLTLEIPVSIRKQVRSPKNP